jgi:hypothetical protein
MKLLALDSSILCVNDGEFLTMTKMSAEHSSGQRNRKLHSLPPLSEAKVTLIPFPLCGSSDVLSVAVKHHRG